MNRLTREPFQRKYDDPLACYKVINNKGSWNFSVQNCINKLGKLEDLEEQLGCPLEVVFKKIEELMEENENRTDYNYCLEYDKFRKLWYIQDYRYYYGSYDVYNPEIYLKDYQKTWWLKGEKPNE